MTVKFKTFEQKKSRLLIAMIYEAVTLDVIAIQRELFF